MYGSMVVIQSATTENRRGKKEEERRNHSCKYNGLWPAPLGGHKQCISLSVVTMMAT